MAWWSVVLAVAGVLGGWSASAAQAVTAKQIDDVIVKAKAYLYSQFKDDNWEETGSGIVSQNKTGATALVTYALLAAGESPGEEHIAKALDYLLHTPTNGTYALGLRCLVWLSLPEEMRGKPEYRQEILNDGKLLLQGGRADTKIKQGASLFYTYLVTDKGPPWDHSNSHYGVLGMWACQECGLGPPPSYWQAVENGWRLHQYQTGGWCYQGKGGVANGMAGPPPVMPEASDFLSERGSMTLAGVSTLYICDEYLHGADAAECRGNVVDANIEAGLAWISRNSQDIQGTDVYYTLYDLERVGLASGLKYFGTVDWFQNGADYLMKNQGNKGNFRSSVISTGYGLLFLAGGRGPVVMNKLKYEIKMPGGKAREGNWNQRPRDAANFAKWMSNQADQPRFKWHVVDLKMSAQDLQEAPILYIAGNQAVDFNDAEIAILRQYVEKGGLIYANADGDSAGFAAAIHKVGSKMFPTDEWHDLPKDSPLFANAPFPGVKWRTFPRMEALGDGTRQRVLLVSSGDPSRFWQTQQYKGHEDRFQFLADIYSYSLAGRR